MSKTKFNNELYQALLDNGMSMSEALAIEREERLREERLKEEEPKEDLFEVVCKASELGLPVREAVKQELSEMLRVAAEKEFQLLNAAPAPWPSEACSNEPQFELGYWTIDYDKGALTNIQANMIAGWLTVPDGAIPSLSMFGRDYVPGGLGTSEAYSLACDDVRQRYRDELRRRVYRTAYDWPFCVECSCNMELNVFWEGWNAVAYWACEGGCHE